MVLNSTNKIVYKSNDYSIFKIPDNFIYRERFYDYLKESIIQKNLLIDCPILIDTNFNIVDGCYRFLVAKSLGIELFYRFTENKRIDHVNIKDIKDKVMADDYLIYYKDNLNYRMLSSELDKFSGLIPKRKFLELMGVNSKSRIKFTTFKNGEYIFEDKYVKKCKRLAILLNEYEWTKEPFNAISCIYSPYEDQDFINSDSDVFTSYPKYVEKYKYLLSTNKIQPQIQAFHNDLEYFYLYNAVSSSSIVKYKFDYYGEERENIITFPTLLLIDRLYETTDTLIMV